MFTTVQKGKRWLALTLALLMTTGIIWSAPADARSNVRAQFADVPRASSFYEATN